MEYPKSVDEILKITDTPVVAADNLGLLVFINQAFTNSYGWTEEDLIGKPITKIMPESFRPLHVVGFSRFLTTGQSKVAGHPLPLAVLFKDGTVKDAEHFILADKKDGQWRFAATIRPR